MSIRIAVPKEREQHEKRVALTPEVAGKLIQKGFEVAIESGAGEKSFFSDDAYAQAGCKIEPDSKKLLSGGQIILKVQPISSEEIEAMADGAMLVGFLFAHRHPEQVKRLFEKKIAVFPMEKIPRVTRAQSMDALSSQSTVAGYKAVLMAADLSSRFFPMLTTAAGTIRPAKVLVLGAGVAGLQAIATAKRLGAIVEAYDVRPAVKEQVMSLGAKFLEIAVDAEAKGGYARELTPEEKKKEQEMLLEHVAAADVVITTAQIPGRDAPKLLPKEMVLKMKPGSVVIDLAAEGGGNCTLTEPGKMVIVDGIKIYGPLNVPAHLPVHASEMYAKNLYNFLMNLTHDGKSLELDMNDEIIRGSLLQGGGK